ncbi:CKLF-like MARVEL transmembrane domain-containing protein 6 [Protopterus annectens]|uniref:CKLF-like MARVEL transmembrane domain-containing protein 6 n=1 Tax=Protopterus annectens TaxID=7888 RepID=UPI001CFBC273|nr:CKLF-like MARVEL transmembrane domain-containing protein 6 [Protopterus annectens]
MSADDANGTVYNRTTEPTGTRKPCECLCFQLDRVGRERFIAKCATVLLSFVAFILEEIVPECIICGGLYFFEFVSCSAFLLSLILLVLLCTSLFNKVKLGNWKLVDFLSVAIVGLLFLAASIAYAATHSNTDLEKTSIAFGFFATIAFGFDAGLSLKYTKPFEKKAGAKSPISESTIKNSPGGETEPLSSQPADA